MLKNANYAISAMQWIGGEKREFPERNGRKLALSRVVHSRDCGEGAPGKVTLFVPEKSQVLCIENISKLIKEFNTHL